MKKALIIIGIVTVLGVGGYLGYKKLVLEKYPAQVEIVLAEEIVSYTPYSFTASNNQILRYIYEPLVKLDNSMNIEPGLAVSFGRLDELTWEFRVNPNARFHNGEHVTAELIKRNFERLETLAQAQPQINSIESIEITGEYTFNISTSFSDPILLNKLALIPITPDTDLIELEQNPNGTGTYKFVAQQDNKVILERFENYPGAKPKFKTVVLTMIPDRDFRVEYVNSITPNVAIVAPFPFGLKRTLDQSRFSLFRYPNLSVNFFLFNFRSGLVTSKSTRDMLMRSISDQDLLTLTDEFGRPTNQYVSSGVFGYNKDINYEKLSEEELQSQVRNLGLFTRDIKVALPRGLDVFKEFLDEQWFNAGLSPEIDLLELPQILSQDTKSNYDLIFLGWKSDNGTSIQFLESIVKPNAEFNLGAYTNTRANQLLNEAKEELDLQERQKKLAEVMRIITVDDPIGIPLFETEVLFAVNDKYKYAPRADGFVDVSNLSL